jgi:DNA-binding transcriptional LysR family regulator
MGVELALGGRYLGCFPEVSVQHHLERKELRALAGIKGLPTFELQALTRRGAAPKRSAALLMAELKRRLRRH